MDISKLFYPRQRAEFIEYDYERQKQYIYQSRIEDIRDGVLYFAEPYYRGFYLPRKYDRQFFIQVPGDDCSYSFTTRLLRCVNEPIPLWVMAMPKEASRKQRRDFVRLDVRLPVQVEVREGEEIKTSFSGTSKDISGSGMGLLLKEADQLERNANILVTFPLGEGAVITAAGRVLRIILPEAEQEKPVAAIQFTKIEERQKDLIVKYVFRKQIERRQQDVRLFRES